MLDEFIEFTQSLFPSISPYVKDKTKEAIKQFELKGKKLNLFNYKAYDYLTQGDIFDGVPFPGLKKMEIYLFIEERVCLFLTHVAQIMMMKL